ncbi:MAG: hypothetical protein AAB944_00285 [Patescibacteria group bacterium]
MLQTLDEAQVSFRERKERVESIGESLAGAIKEKKLLFEEKETSLSAGDRLAFRKADGALSLFRGESAEPIKFGCTDANRLLTFLGNLSLSEASRIARTIAERFKFRLKADPFGRKKDCPYITFMLA